MKPGMIEVARAIGDPDKPVTVPAFVLADLVMAVMVKAGRRQVESSIEAACAALGVGNLEDSNGKV